MRFEFRSNLQFDPIRIFIQIDTCLALEKCSAVADFIIIGVVLTSIVVIIVVLAVVISVIIIIVVVRVSPCIPASLTQINDINTSSNYVPPTTLGMHSLEALAKE
jgi:hypothetical protein